LKPYLIIVAGGTGKRMQSDIPKQFLPVKNKAILQHTIDVFVAYNPDIQIVLVLSELYHKLWRTISQENNYYTEYQIIKGGKERFFSVKNALDCIPPDCIVGVHDAVRPCVSKETITRAYASARRHGNGIPVVPVRESLREITNQTSKAVDRNKFVSVQTPQCFKSDILKKAYTQEFQPSFTDDASVVQAAGYKIHTVKGNIENIKITEPSDLLIAEIFLP